MTSERTLKKTSFEDIRDFVIATLWQPSFIVNERTALAHDFHLAGQDGDEFMRHYAQTFGVNLEGFDSADYFGAERSATLSGLITSLYQRFVRQKLPRDMIALPELTLGHLLIYANEGKWKRPV